MQTFLDALPLAKEKLMGAEATGRSGTIVGDFAFRNGSPQPFAHSRYPSGAGGGSGTGGGPRNAVSKSITTTVKAMIVKPSS